MLYIFVAQKENKESKKNEKESEKSQKFGILKEEQKKGAKNGAEPKKKGEAWKYDKEGEMKNERYTK